MKKFNLELEEQQVNSILEALANTPFRISAPIIQVIQGQCQAQIAEQLKEAEK